MEKRFPLSKIFFFTLFLFFIQGAFFSIAKTQPILSSEAVIKAQLKAATSDIEKADILQEAAWNNKNSNPTTAFQYINQSIDIAEKIYYKKGMANGYHTKGMLYWYRSDHQLASEFFFKALNLRKEIEDHVGLARSYNNIGNIYFQQKNYRDALSYYQTSLNIRRDIKDSIGLIYSYNNIADVFVKQKKHKNAVSQYNKALTIAIEKKYTDGEAFINSNLGAFQLQMKAYQPAYLYFENAYALYQKSNNKNGIAQNLNFMSNILIEQKNDFPKAISFAKKSLEIAKEIQATQIKATAYSNLSKANALLNNFKDAYVYEQLFRSSQMEIFDEKSRRAVIEIQSKYENVVQKNELLVKEQEIMAKNNSIGLIFIFIIFLSIFFIYSKWRYQEEAYAVLSQKNQALINSNEALERFAYVSSHDLKEPLRSIGSFSTLLKRRYFNLLDEDGRDYVNFIVKGVDQMYHLLDDLLEYSKIIHKKDVPLKSVNLNHVLDSVQQSLSHSIEEKNVKLQIDALPIITTNKTQMHQLFQNLINNAIKFNDKEYPAIDVQCQMEEKAYLFIVKDNGIGIKEEYQNKIFGVFQRLSKGEYPGTGVGLAICQKIVEQHKGEIWVESVEGKGSAFHFRIPELDN